jgi:hypothetical protein
MLENLKSLRCKKEILKWKNRSKLILYPTNFYYQNDLHNRFYPTFSDNLQWDIQKALVNVFAKYFDYKTIVKYHPSHDYRDPPLEKYSEKKGFINIRFIKNEYTFAELIQCADIIVLDYPTTTLLQSLTTDKPVFVYTGQLKIDKDALELLKKRAYCFDILENLKASLDSYLKGLYLNGRVDFSDDKFLIKYGVHMSNSKDRVIEILRDIITEKD